MQSRARHRPSYLLGVVGMLALLSPFATSWRAALSITLCCSPWVFAFLLAHADHRDVDLLAGMSPADAARRACGPQGAQPAEGLHEKRTPHADWL